MPVATILGYQDSGVSGQRYWYELVYELVFCYLRVTLSGLHWQLFSFTSELVGKDRHIEGKGPRHVQPQIRTCGMNSPVHMASTS